MPTPKSNQEKMEKMLNAWRTLAPNKTFGGLTLPQFEAIVAPCQAARQKISNLEDQLTHEINERGMLDEVFLSNAQLVVNGVLADPTEGPDSSLYEAMGYTRKSERRSGLTRKANGGTTPPPAPK